MSELVYHCIKCDGVIHIEKGKNIGNLRHCSKCYNYYGKYKKRKSRGSYVTKKEWLLFLVKSQDADIGMCRAFTKSSVQMVRQYMTQLRQDGHHISLKENGFYEYRGFLP